MPRITTPLLSEALSAYLATRRPRLARTTYQNDHSVLHRFVKGVANPQVHRLSPEAVEGWFAQIADEQQPSSFNKVRSRVAGFLAFCGRRGWLSSDPLTEVLPRRVDRPERLQLSAVQLTRLLESADQPRDRAMLATAMNTALRSSDLVGLSVGSVDLDGGWIRLRVRKTGRTDAMPITAELDTELRAWLGVYAGQLAERGQGLEPEHRLFPAYRQPRAHLRAGVLVRERHYLMPERAMSHPARIVHEALRSIGITATHQEGWHTVRRSVGRIVLEHASEVGEDQALRVVQAMYGHKSSATTELYLQLNRDRQRRDELLRGRSLYGPAAAKLAVVKELRQSNG